MATIVVEQPDNDIMVGLSEHNPYKQLDQNLDTLEEPLTSNNIPHRIYFGTTIVRLDPEDLNMAVRLQNYAHVIKFVCIMDFFMAMMNFVLFMNGFFFLCGLFDMIGYYGVLQFNKTYLHIYSVYHIILGIVCAMAIWFFVHQDNKVGPLVLTSLGMIFHFWMCKIVRNFIWMFPQIRITDAA